MKTIPATCFAFLFIATLACDAAEQQTTAPTPNADATTTDAAVAADRVKQALRSDPGAAKVLVSTHASTVLLTGTVAGEADALRIRALAESAAAGARITSQLELDPAHQQVAGRESALAREVEAALKRDAATASLSVLVAIDEQQRIVLLGPVPTAAARAAAERVAARVPGVGRIENRLVVPD